jgi:peptidoglycan hydrolase-like protein with peptidoglycan-binding domain
MKFSIIPSNLNLVALFVCVLAVSIPGVSYGSSMPSKAEECPNLDHRSMGKLYPKTGAPSSVNYEYAKSDPKGGSIPRSDKPSKADIGFCPDSYVYSGDNAPNNTPAIKSEIESLIARIKALNEQIKTGIAPNSEVKDSIKDIPKKDDNKGVSLCKAITPGLALGSKDSGIGRSVSTLQKSLRESGHFKGEATGYFGTQTRDAVRSFQKANDIASYGDEKTTGYGRVGEKTWESLSEKCMKEDTAKAFTLVDVATMTSQRIDPIKMAADDEYTHYVVTLTDKTTREVKHGFARVTLEERFKKIGYTGDLKALLAKVTVLPTKVVPKKFVVDDIATITGKAIDPSTGVADDEYTQYTITFKNGAVTEVNGHAGRGTEETRLAPLRKAGYRGTLDVFLEKVNTPAVLGAEATDTDALLREFIMEVDALLKKVE